LNDQGKARQNGRTENMLKKHKNYKKKKKKRKFLCVRENGTGSCYSQVLAGSPSLLGVLGEANGQNREVTTEPT